MTAWRDERFAVVDLETTGLDPTRHEILSIGVVDVVGGRVQVSSAWYREVRPQIRPGADTVVVHGIRPADASRAAAPECVAPEALARLQGRRLVAHVATIETGFLSQWLGPLGWRARPDPVDTDALVHLHLQRSRGLTVDGHVGLGAAAGLFGLPEHRRHHALGDALTTAQLLTALASTWPGGEPSAEQLAAAGRGRALRRLLPRRVRR